MPDEDWTPGRLRDRFDDVGRRIGDVEASIRVLAPLVGQVGVAEADVEGLQEDMRVLRLAVADLDRGVTDVIRHGRAEQLKYLAYIVGPALVITGGLLFSGKGP